MNNANHKKSALPPSENGMATYGLMRRPVVPGVHSVFSGVEWLLYHNSLFLLIYF
jgi:hypothetical protein